MTVVLMAHYNARSLDNDVDRIVLDVQRLQTVDNTEIVRRNEETAQPDGYGAGAGDVVVQSQCDDTSTERAALYGLLENGEPDDWRRHVVADPVGKAIDEYVDAIRTVRRELAKALRKAEYVRHVKDSARGRQSSLAGKCKACDRDVAGTTADPFRSGYCKPCYDAWWRLGMPVDSQRQFERDRWLRTHPTCDAADELDFRRRQHADADGVGPMPPVIPLAGENNYRRHELPPAVDPDDVIADMPCRECKGTMTRHYTWCALVG